jgi:hypothetical protein
MSNKKLKFKVLTKFVFEGVFNVEAETMADAYLKVEKHCGMTTDRGIHSSLPDDQIDWDFPVHPTKEIVDVNDK